MSTLKAILVDDELQSLTSLKFELETYCKDVEVIATSQDPVEALKIIEVEKPDLLFLDIEMPVMNGFELLQSIPKIEFDVIFVTAYDEFAVRAFDFNAIDYLLKPVLKSKLIQAVTKVSQKKNHRFDKDHLAALIQNVNRDNHIDEQLDSIAIPTQEGFEMIDVKSISYLAAEGNYTWLHSSDEKKYLISKNLKEVASIINRNFFFRAHKSYLINLNQIKKYVRGRGGYLILKDGSNIPVARNQKQELLKIMNL